MKGHKISHYNFISFFLALCCLGCSTPEKSDQLFERISSTDSGIAFSNNLSFTPSFNIFNYNNFYSGGGVALGDVNKDGLIDIYLSSNQKSNKLYLNKGNFRFEDITKNAGVEGVQPWSTGVSMVDINGDGRLDIYVCNAGLFKTHNRANELFINNGDLTFTEKAEEYGLADTGLSTQASFFDYDKDGDLDMYLLNYSSKPINSFNLKDTTLRYRKDLEGGDRLYRNNSVSNAHGSGKDPTFTEVTEQAGIYNGAINFGLGATIGDINADGWMDIYVSNDFFERDYLYINNKDGTFQEVLEQQMNDISTTSMSGDIADLNNDGFPEIFIADMLPSSENRLKTIADFIGWESYQSEVEMGYFRKFERNMLHLNNGNNTFSEIGRYAGVEASGWSWGGLIADFNVDGRRDIFVPNGTYKDVTDKDLLLKISNPNLRRSFTKNGQINYKKLNEATPSQPLPNAMFKNSGHLQFVDKATEWGLGEPSFSHGAAYGDLNNDGTLDIVVNNVNMEPFIYRNNANKLNSKKSWVQVSLDGKAPNTYGVGAQIEVIANGHSTYSEQILQRGFQSSVDPKIHIGLPPGTSLIDTLKVSWPDGSISLKTSIQPSQLITIGQKNAHRNNRNEGEGSDKPLQKQPNAQKPWLTDITKRTGLRWKHKESLYNDFKKAPLLFHMRSTEGPALCTADINNDGYEDFYVGGAAGQSGALFIQRPGQKFKKTVQPALETSKNSEDVDCAFFDATGDGNLELYVASGSSEFAMGDNSLADQLYKFDKNGSLFIMDGALPQIVSLHSTGVVKPGDLDNDGDMDLFVGTRLNNQAYGIPVGGFLLKNEGNGTFKNKTKTLAPQLKAEAIQSAGITDAEWGDMNKDGALDLVVAGEWMPITIFLNRDGRLERANPATIGLPNLSGLWQSVTVKDLNKDGALDIVGGNLGLNSRFRSSSDHPMHLFVADFDGNGHIEQILSRFNTEKGPYPIALRQNLVGQLPYLKSRFPTFADYAETPVDQLFQKKQMKHIINHKIEQLASVVAWNNGKGKFDLMQLPPHVQFSPIYAILAEDLQEADATDLILGGNLSSVKPQIGPYNASYGTILRRDSTHTFHNVPFSVSGFFNQGEIRAIRTLRAGDKRLLLVAFNNQPLKVFGINSLQF